MESIVMAIRPSILPGPGLGALLSSYMYLEGALYKFHG